MHPWSVKFFLLQSENALPILANMSIKIIHGNSVFECSTPEEAVKIHALLQGGSHLSNGATKNHRTQSSTPSAGVEHYDDNAVRWALDLLRAINAAGPAGLTTNSVMPLVQANGAKAMGGRMAVVNRLLQELGYPKVYTNTKVEGVRIWKGRKNIDEAITKLAKLQTGS